MAYKDETMKKAEQLAKRGYSIELEEDTLSDGTRIYMARNPELPGCKAQGATMNEAEVVCSQIVDSDDDED
jgi:hypothetical protein